MFRLMLCLVVYYLACTFGAVFVLLAWILKSPTQVKDGLPLSPFERAFSPEQRLGVNGVDSTLPNKVTFGKGLI